MKRSSQLLAGIMLLILAINMVDGAMVSRPITQTKVIKGPTAAQFSAPTIYINAIFPAGSYSGNSQRVGVQFNVTPAIGDAICGLNGTNFKLETLSTPPYGPGVAILSVGASATPVGMSPQPCSYILNIVPETIGGSQGTWVGGAYSVKLYYVKDGKEISSTTFQFGINGPGNPNSPAPTKP